MNALGGAVVGVLAQRVPRFSRLGAFGEYLRWAALFFGVGLGGGIAATARRMRDIEEA